MVHLQQKSKLEDRLSTIYNIFFLLKNFQGRQLLSFLTVKYWFWLVIQVCSHKHFDCFRSDNKKVDLFICLLKYTIIFGSFHPLLFPSKMKNNVLCFIILVFLLHFRLENYLDDEQIWVYALYAFKFDKIVETYFSKWPKIN